MEFGTKCVSTDETLMVISVTFTVRDSTNAFDWSGERGFH